MYSKKHKIMKQTIGYITLLVRDYKRHHDYYTKKLRFNLVEDTELGGGKRWVVVAPPGFIWNKRDLLELKA